MRRFAPVLPVLMVLMVPMVLLLALPALAQPGDQAGAQAEPSAARSGSLEAEVAQLRQLVAEHERRIAALEAALAKLAPAPMAADATEESAEEVGQPMIAPATSSGSAASSAAQTTFQDQAEPPADLPPWARKEAWRKIQIGMSEDEVQALLGKPSATREIGFSRKLIYKGAVPGRGYLKGVVSFRDGRVSDLDLPDF